MNSQFRQNILLFIITSLLQTGALYGMMHHYFLYIGEANVLQENLDSFLALAEELRLKGLTGTENSGKTKEPAREVEENFRKGNKARHNQDVNIRPQPNLTLWL